MTGCGKRSPRTVLVVAMGHDLRLFERHLRHYRALGVDDVLVDIQTGSGNADELLESVTATAARHGAQIVAVEPGPYTGTRVRRERLVAAHCRPDDWLVIADLDEFHEYPTRLDRITAYCDAHGYDFVMGELVDRVAPGGVLAELDERPLSAQFPLGCHLTRDLCGGWSRKVVLARPAVAIVEGNHEALCGNGCPEERIHVPIHHFRWDARVVDKNRFMIDSIRERGLYHWNEKERLLRHLEAGGGRIDVTSRRLGSRALGGTIPAIDDRSRCSGAQAMISPVSDCHRRPVVAPCTWMDDAQAQFEVHGPGGTARFSNSPIPALLWQRCHGKVSLRQIELAIGESPEVAGEAIGIDVEATLRRIVEQLRCVGAIHWHDESPRPGEGDRPLRLLYVDDRVPHGERNQEQTRSEGVLRAMPACGFAPTMFPTHGFRWQDARQSESLSAAGVAVVSIRRSTTLGRFLYRHLELFDAIWARGRDNFELVTRHLATRHRQPALVLDDGHHNPGGDHSPPDDGPAPPSHADIIVRAEPGPAPQDATSTPVFVIPRAGDGDGSLAASRDAEAPGLESTLREIRRRLAQRPPGSGDGHGAPARVAGDQPAPPGPAADQGAKQTRPSSAGGR